MTAQEDTVNSTIVRANCTHCGAEVHRARGLVDGTPDWRQHVVCRDCREADEPADVQITQMLADRIRQRWTDKAAAFDAGARLEDAQLDAAPAAVWQQRAHDALAEWLDPERVRSRSGLMICGPTGIGKTWAAFALANAVADLGYGADIRAASETELMGPQVATWQLESHLRRSIDGAAMVIVDDIGVAPRHRDQLQAAWKMLADLVSSQPRSMLVVGTSNRQSWAKESGLTEWVGQQTASRLRSWTSICTTGAVDRRTGDTHENWARQTSRSK